MTRTSAGWQWAPDSGIKGSLLSTLQGERLSIDEFSLQGAMALLGGQDSSTGIASRLGLDELSVSGATGGASATTVTLGKRISQNFYVNYERSLAGTLGTFSIFYDLSERLTLRARTGEKSAVDLLFKFSYD